MKNIPITPELRAEVRRIAGPEIGATMTAAFLDDDDRLRVTWPAGDDEMSGMAIGRLEYRLTPVIEPL